jgi:hypothetical protein
MRTHVKRTSLRTAMRPALALVVAVTFMACASDPTTKDDAAVQAPPAAPAPEAPAATPTAPAPAMPPAKAPSATAPARPPLPEGTTYLVHTIRYQGETISIIAAWYLGDKMRFDVLAAANPEINPAQVRVGMRIKIPESLAKTKEPMPKEFVDGFYKRTPTEKSPLPARSKDEEPVPIGPK